MEDKISFEILQRCGEFRQAARASCSAMAKNSDPPVKSEYLKNKFEFLGLNEYYMDDCEPLSGWGAVKIKNTPCNITGITVNHGLPVQKDLCIGKAIFSVDVLERMIKEKWFTDTEKNQKYMIFFTHGMHMAGSNLLTYYNRLIAMRNIIIEYKKHSPKTLFVYKTINYVRGNFKDMYATAGSFHAYRMREIAFKVFGNPYLEDIRDDAKYPVKVYDAYALTMTAFDYMKTGNVLPPEPLNGATSKMLIDLADYVGFIDM